jgi:hypothetical protein
VAVTAAYTNIAVGFDLALAAQIEGRMSFGAWDFGDATVVSNRLQVSHSWLQPGDYAVRFTGYNESNPAGVCATVLVHVARQPVYYVDAGNASPAFPYDRWETAAQTIQEAIEAGATAGRLVLVTNGTYQVGGTADFGLLTNRVALKDAVSVLSINGPAVTWIVGDQVNFSTGLGGVRCAYVGGDAVLSGFTMTNGSTLYYTGDAVKEQCGGGVWCEIGGTVSNCVMVGNYAANSGGGSAGGTLKKCVIANNLGYYGGGSAWGTLQNCVVFTNRALLGGGSYACLLESCDLFYNQAWEGGGSTEGELNNSTLVANSANKGGGSSGDVLNNCIVYYNTSEVGEPGNYDASQFAYSCTMPLADGVGNIAADPLFVNWLENDFRLQPNSPCINSGNDRLAGAFLLDLDGKPRMMGAHVDMGAFEYVPLAPSMPDLGCFQMTVTWSDATQDYRLGYKTNLSDAAWRSLNAWKRGNGSKLYLTDPAATNQFRFYRLETRPSD